MLERIKTSLCHPKYIGLFFKDKYYKVIALILIFLAFFSTAIITKSLLTDQFGNGQALSVEKAIQFSVDTNGKKPELELSFDSKEQKFVGKMMSFNDNGVVVSFLKNEDIKSQNKVSINLHEDYYVIYYGYYKLGTGKYDNKELKSFDVKGVQSGNIDDCIKFRSFLIIIFDTVQVPEALVISFQAIISNLVYYVFVVVLCLLSAYFLNPAIEFKIRMKLVLYDSLSYFYWFVLALLFNVSWLQYVALIVPFLYTNITFAHIRRIR